MDFEELIESAMDGAKKNEFSTKAPAVTKNVNGAQLSVRAKARRVHIRLQEAKVGQQAFMTDGPRRDWEITLTRTKVNARYNILNKYAWRNKSGLYFGYRFHQQIPANIAEVAAIQKIVEQAASNPDFYATFGKRKAKLVCRRLRQLGLNVPAPFKTRQPIVNRGLGR